MYKKGDFMKNKEEKAPNVSGSFQVVNDQQKEDIQNLKEKQNLDEESLNYARLFAED
jgi:hypothetical protein